MAHTLVIGGLGGFAFFTYNCALNCDYNIDMTENTEPLRILTPNWLAYCADYARTLDMQHARDASGLTVNCVRVHASDWIVQNEILKNMDHIATIANVDKSMVLRKLYDFTEADIIDMYDEHGGWLPIREWPKELRQQIVNFELCPLTGRVLKVKFINKLNVLQLLGKHVDVGAFEERQRVVHDITDRLAARLSEARKRVAAPGSVIEGEIVNE